MELRHQEKSLLELGTLDLITQLEKDKALVHVKGMAFEYWSKNNETFQVQITVTRDEADFLLPFETEEMINYNPGGK